MDIVIRASIVFFVLWALLRVIGRRELSELTPFDLVVLIVLGDLVQQGITQEDMSITGSVLAAGTMVAWTIIISAGTYWSKTARRVFKGVPLIVVRDGEIYDQVMRAQRIDREYLHDAARQQGIADLDEVRLGVLEPDGMFSFIKRDSSGPASTPGHDVA
ncbi:MAG: YetF domain-containing protein [Solirubrobacterales bacterium]